MKIVGAFKTETHSGDGGGGGGPRDLITWTRGRNGVNLTYNW